MSGTTWTKHLVRLGDVRFESDDAQVEPDRQRSSDIESWLGAILQSEHLSLLLGNGFTTAQTLLAGGVPPSMASEVTIDDENLNALVSAESERMAETTGRGVPNIEDSLRSALMVESGLRILNDPRADLLAVAIAAALEQLRTAVLAAEAAILSGSTAVPVAGAGELTSTGYLASFLLTFANRAPTRDRLGIFTTNYDRLVEYACDVAGLRVLDRFVGALAPEFRSSRIDVDYHYNPPGIRGEPRFLDGVVRLSKLHGSVDWQWRGRSIVRNPAPFGGVDGLHAPASELLIYPNAAKDFETAFYPYAELFRDFSAALCRPNSVLVCYGYSFGDDHINRVIADMLAIPSTHLLIIAWDDVGQRIERFATQHGREGQLSVLLGPHFGALAALVEDVLPAPAKDGISWRRSRLLREISTPEASGPS